MIRKPKRHQIWAKISDVNTTTEHPFLGKHLIAEFWGGKIIENPRELEQLLIGAAKAGNNTPIGVKIHKFNPQGITGIVLLAESHISFHSWPENDYIAIDILGCGRKSFPEKALRYLKEKIRPRKTRILEVKRGTKNRRIKPEIWKKS